MTGDAPETNTQRSDPTDYWSLPKSGPRITLLNSAWTWTALTYVFILGIAVLTAFQNGLQFAGSGSLTQLLIALLLIYPAYRIGSLISRFLKKRTPAIDETSPVPGKTKGKTPQPGSIEARMAERRARVEKAREAGKL